MKFDKKVHKEMVIQMINITNFPGNALEAAMELKKAVLEATVEESIHAVKGKKTDLSD